MADQFRPEGWNSYIGQEALKGRLRIHISAANERNDPLDHVLLVGPPGCGKTSIASLIAAEHYADFESYVMPMNMELLGAVMADFQGVLFLDEIHRLTSKQQESLLTVIEDREVQFGNGISYECPLLTVVAATTEPQDVIEPLYDRFLIKPPFDRYSDGEMALIVQGMAEKVGIDFSHDDAVRLGRATGGVPRNAKSLVSMARDLKTTNIERILRTSRVTEDGLTEYHLKYLQSLVDCGGKAGLSLIAAHVRLPAATLVDLERLLIERNMIQYTKQGRAIGPAGFKIVKQMKGSW